MAIDLKTGTAPTFAFGQGGLFREMAGSVFSRYSLALNWRDRLAGGTPSDPKLIQGWLKAKMPGMDSDTERRHMLIRTLEDMGAELPTDQDIMSISMEQLEEAAEKVAATRGANGFKRPNRVVKTVPMYGATGEPLLTKDGVQRTEQVVVHPGYLAIETRHLKSAVNGALTA